MISANTLFFTVFGIALIMGIRARGFTWLIPFFFSFCLIMLTVDPRTDETELVDTIVVQENNGALYFEYDSYSHTIHQDTYLHTWGCIEKGDSIHVYLTKHYIYKDIEFSRKPTFKLVKEE